MLALTQPCESGLSLAFAKCQPLPRLCTHLRWEVPAVWLLSWGKPTSAMSHWSARATWQVLAVPWGQKRGLLSGVSPQGRHPSLDAPTFFLPTSCPPNSKGARPGNLISNHIHTLTMFATLVNFLFFPGLWFPKDETGQWGLSHGKLRSLPSLTVSVPRVWHSMSRETWLGFVVRTS